MEHVEYAIVKSMVRASIRDNPRALANHILLISYE